MILRRVKKFVGNQLGDIQSYLSVELNKFLNDVAVTLGHLTFKENFDSFSQSFTLASSATISIPNQLLTTNIDWIVTRISGDNRLVEDVGWTAKELFLKNVGAVSITATVFFFRR